MDINNVYVKTAYIELNDLFVKKIFSRVGVGRSTKYVISGNFEELEKYGLVYTYANQKQGLDKALELLENKNLKNLWKMRREKLPEEKIYVTAFMTNFIENYPESFKNM